MAVDMLDIEGVYVEAPPPLPPSELTEQPGVGRPPPWLPQGLTICPPGRNRGMKMCGREILDRHGLTDEGCELGADAPDYSWRLQREATNSVDSVPDSIELWGMKIFG